MYITDTVIEQPGSLKLRDIRNGRSGTRIWWCRCDEIDNTEWFPVRGVSSFTAGLGWPASWRDNLICVSIEVDPVDSVRRNDLPPPYNEYEWWEIKAEYREVTDINIWSCEWQGQGDMVKAGFGYTWALANCPCEQPISLPVPAATVQMSRKITTVLIDVDEMMQCWGKVNSEILTIASDITYTFPVGTLLFGGWSVKRYDSAYQTVTFSFKYNPRGHRWTWREAIPQVDDKGSYLRDANGFILMRPGVAGTAAWDYTTPEFFSSRNFKTMMGLA